jgi:hypothetical protein
MSAVPDEPQAAAPVRPVAEVLVAAAVVGGLAGAAVGAIDGLWSWRALAQFTPGLARLRVLAYLATSYAIAGILVSVGLGAIALFYSRVTRLGTLVRHAAREHARRPGPRAIPRTRWSACRWSLSFVRSLATVALAVGFPRLVHGLFGRKNFALVVAVAMVGAVVLTGAALALAIAVRPRARGRAAAAGPGPARPALSSVWTPAVALAAMVAIGAAVIIVRTWSVTRLLPLRLPAIALARWCWRCRWAPVGARLATRWAALPPRWRRSAPALVPLAAFLVAALAGNRPGVIKAAVAYSGAGDPLTRAVEARRRSRSRRPLAVVRRRRLRRRRRPRPPRRQRHPRRRRRSELRRRRRQEPARRRRPGFVPLPPGVPADANIVLITIDTLRADHLSSYGYPRPTTPTLDAIAAGRHPLRRRLGPRAVDPLLDAGDPHRPAAARRLLRHLVAGWPGLLPRATTIAEALRDRGFATGAFTNYWYFDRSRRMDQGFDVYDNDNARLHQGADPAHTRGSSSRQQTDKALGFVAAHASQRFFLWVHYYDPHHEYEPHPEVPSFGGGEVDRYDQEIRFTDLHIGRLFDDLKARGLWDKTVIVVTGDHGEGFGEHGVLQHGYHLYARADQGAADRPRPRPAAAGVDHRGRPRRHLADLGQPGRRRRHARDDGRSLVPLLAGAPDDPDRVVFQQLSYEGNHEMRGAATADCHVLYNVSPHTSWEVYRLADDPTETHDRADAPGRCAAVRASFERWYDSAQIPPGAAAALLPDRPAIARRSTSISARAVRLLAVDAPAEVHPGQSFDHLDLRGPRPADRRLEGVRPRRGPGRRPVHRRSRAGAAVRVVAPRPVHPLHRRRQRAAQRAGGRLRHVDRPVAQGGAPAGARAGPGRRRRQPGQGRDHPGGAMTMPAWMRATFW